MFEFQLPFGLYFGCSICGLISKSKKEVEECEVIGIAEKPDVKLGDVVLLYQNAWVGNRFIGMTDKPEPHTVTSLYYAAPGTCLSPPRKFQRPNIHQLCIHLSQFAPGGNEPVRELRAGDKYGGFSRIDMTYAEFILWREGDKKKLGSAGLVGETVNTLG